jgi:hypothetical protein
MESHHRLSRRKPINVLGGFVAKVHCDFACYKRQTMLPPFMYPKIKTSANGVCINDINTLRLAVGEIPVCAGIAMGQDVVIPLSR